MMRRRRGGEGWFDDDDDVDAVCASGWLVCEGTMEGARWGTSSASHSLLDSSSAGKLIARRASPNPDGRRVQQSAADLWKAVTDISGQNY
jgi:hypothetical protein